MTTTNKNDANKVAVLSALDSVRSALSAEPLSPQRDRALEQCERLQLAITQFHAEGLRFAAFTLLRLVQNSGTTFNQPVRDATRQLEQALDAARYPH